MTSCERCRDLFTSYLEGEVSSEDRVRLDSHLEGCPDCEELLQTMRMVTSAAAPMAELEPPEGLASDLASSPCRRWLTLLFAAIDREISDHNLSRLLGHLEDCEACRRAWQDMTLIHQVGEAMIPPRQLLDRCVTVHRSRYDQPILGRRTATAAAYFLAILASLVIGNPVTLARNPAAVAAQRVADTVSTGVTDVASEGRGEIRVMLWRTWKWSSRQVATIRETLSDLSQNNDSDTEQGETS